MFYLTTKVKLFFAVFALIIESLLKMNENL